MFENDIESDQPPKGMVPDLLCLLFRSLVETDLWQSVFRELPSKSPCSALLPFFWGGLPTKIDYRRKSCTLILTFQFCRT